MKNLIDKLKEQGENIKTQFKEIISTPVGKAVAVLGTLMILSVPYMAWRNSSIIPKYEIEPIVCADFDNDGKRDIIGYTPDPVTSTNQSVLAYINGRDVEKMTLPGFSTSEGNVPESFVLYVDVDKIKVIQVNAETRSKRNLTNISVQDVDDNGFLDISYDMTIGAKKHKTAYNQGNGTFKIK